MTVMIGRDVNSCARQGRCLLTTLPRARYTPLERKLRWFSAATGSVISTPTILIECFAGGSQSSDAVAGAGY